MELAYLACGRLELFFKIKLSPWDFTAGEVLILEAGGCVGTLPGQKMDHQQAIPFIAANSTVNFERLVTIIHSIMATASDS